MNRSADEPVQLEKHPPERRQAKVVTTHCGCCCCCCCCLHWLGAVVGAAVGSIPARSRDTESFVQDPDDPDVYHKVEDVPKGSPVKVVLIYWFFAVTAFFALPLFSERGPAWTGWVAWFYLPIVLGAACVPTLLVTSLTYRGENELKQVGKLALGIIIGTAIGTGLMWAICMGNPL